MNKCLLLYNFVRNETEMQRTILNNMISDQAVFLLGFYASKRHIPATAENISRYPGAHLNYTVTHNIR